jgi:high-affinity Fe2+/Pb2+ permease
VAIRRDVQATIRLAIEKGQSLDPALIEQVMQSNRRNSAAGLTGGAVLVATGLGLPIMGYFISLGGNARALYPLTGVGFMILLVGVALLLVWRFHRRSERAGESGQIQNP